MLSLTVLQLFNFSLENFSDKIRWSMDLRWQRPDKPNGFYGLKVEDNANSSLENSAWVKNQRFRFSAVEQQITRYWSYFRVILLHKDIWDFLFLVHSYNRCRRKRLEIMLLEKPDKFQTIMSSDVSRVHTVTEKSWNLEFTFPAWKSRGN